MPDPLRTNRDLYLFVAALVENDKAHERELEEYLRALWSLGSGERERSADARVLCSAPGAGIPGTGTGIRAGVAGYCG